MLPLPFYLTRVLDLTTSPAGAYASRFFADLGAQTVLVERSGRPRPAEADFANLQRNKLSCLLALDRAEAQAACRRLALACNVVFVDADDPQLAAAGLDYDSLTAGRPGLIYVRVDRAGGLAAGLAAAAGAAAAMFHHRATASGQKIDVRAAAFAPESNGDAANGVSFEGTRRNEAIGTAEGEVVEVESVPYEFSATPAHVRLPAPGRGQHTHAVLQELAGLSEDDIEGLRAAGALDG